MSRKMLGVSANHDEEDYIDIRLDEGKKIFRFDKTSGANVYIISAKSLSIAWGDDEKYWRWVDHANSKFSEVAELRNVCWFDISGKINCKELSRKTNYVAYFIYRTKEKTSDLDIPYEAILSVGNNESKKAVCLKPIMSKHYPNVKLPQARRDGWMEIKLGEFYNDNGEDGEVTMKISQVKDMGWKGGLFVEGIEIRAKHR